MKCKTMLVLLLMGMTGSNVFAEEEPRSGQVIYDVSCKVCHDQGVAGAPKVGDEQWVMRLANKGMQGLVDSVKNGLNVMPPMGMCGDCSEQEIINAIQLMLPEEKPM